MPAIGGALRFPEAGLKYDFDMAAGASVTGVSIQPAPASSEVATSRSSFWPVLATVLLAILVGAVLGYVAYLVESPGLSPAGACALCAFAVVVIAVVGWLFFKRGDRTLGRFFVLSIAVVGVLVVWWAWAFAMPAAMAWDSTATPNAIAALRNLPSEHSVCKDVASGSVGPLAAPYERCAVIGQTGGQVEYFAGSSRNSPVRGLLFFDGSQLAGSGQFVRHLVGDWYAFTQDPSGALGYSFTGAG